LNIILIIATSFFCVLCENNNLPRSAHLKQSICVKE